MDGWSVIICVCVAILMGTHQKILFYGDTLTLLEHSTEFNGFRIQEVVESQD